MIMRKQLACDCGDGFSLVELLITIIIAGVVFAAMVPFFMNVVTASSRDRVRNVATDVAQTRIENIRLLSFSQLSDPSIATNLSSAGFANGQFGSTYMPPGGSSVYTVSYSVTNVPSTGAVNYVRVAVSVTTPSPPSS